MNRRRVASVAATMLAVSAGLAACSGNPAARPGVPQATDYSTASADPTGSPGSSVSPQSPGAPGTAGGSVSPGSTPSDGGTTGSTPGGAGSSSVSPGSEATPATPGDSSSGLPAGAQPASCTQITPIRVLDTTAQPRRATEVVSVVSDGKSVQSGTRTQTDFADPSLTSPLNTQLTDQTSLQQVAGLVSGSGKVKVLLSRPDAPDAQLNPDKRPFNQPGTYVLYNASALLNATVLVQCSGQEQRWTFTAESAPLSGQVNCAVDPPRSNSLARSVFGSDC